MRDFTYVDDAVDAFLMAGASDAANGQVFNLGGIEPISLRDVTELLIELAGTGSYHLVPFPPERKAHRHRLDLRRRSQDPPRPAAGDRSVDMREGLARSIEFYRAHRAQYWAAARRRHG